jgi:hypothetical protein
VLPGHNPTGFSFEVAVAGDVDGDGFEDVVIGSYVAGQCHLVFGKADGDPVDAWLMHETGAGIAMLGHGHAGRAVAGAGDVNGDGFADVLVGAPRVSDGAEQGTGRVYVVFGGPDLEDLALEDIRAGVGGFAIDDNEASGSHAGISVDGVGDMNDDGLADIVIGGYQSDAVLAESGRAYLVFGKTDGDEVDLEEIAAGVGGFVMDGEAENDHAGWSVAGAGDVDDDGVPDVVIGAPDAGAGRVYVVHGKATFEPVLLADVAAGIGGFAIDGPAGSEAGAGRDVDGAGDVNADGLADLVIAAPAAVTPTSGLAYVVFGTQDTAMVELADVEAGVGGFAIEGVSDSDRAAASVAGAGDRNADGMSDVLVTARDASAGGSVFLVFGKASTERVLLGELAESEQGIEHVGEGDGFGYAVDGGGDVNADGVPDLVVGAPYWDKGGRGYVFFGWQ